MTIEELKEENEELSKQLTIALEKIDELLLEKNRIEIIRHEMYNNYEAFD